MKLTYKISALLALLAFVILWFAPLNARHLVKTDEGRYAEIPREMVVTGDWLTPRQNGIKYFEKPPLQYWATAVAYEVFGFQDWVARFWTALTGFMGIVLSFVTARHLWGPSNSKAGWVAAGIQASSLLYGLLGHINTLDMGLCFGLQLALCGFLLRENPHWMLASWVGIAIAILSKGLIGLLLPGMVLTILVLVTRRWSIIPSLMLLRGTLLMLLITAPWFVLVSQQNPEFAHFFFIHEHLDRFLTKVHNRSGPWWYFFPIFILGSLPWLGVMLHALLDACKASWQYCKTKPTETNSRLTSKEAIVTLVLWSILIFAFFSKSNSKLPSYILPIFPSLALLVAWWSMQVKGQVLKWHLVSIALFSAVGIGLLPLLTRLADDKYPADFYAHLASYIQAGYKRAVWNWTC
jgi:4-amino-4-deoxy-L-arabinose transferase-like glycosyltransferase